MKWPEKKIGDLTEVLSGFAFDSQFFNNEMGFKLIRIRDVVRGFSETFYNGKFEDRYVVKEGDFLIGMDGEFNIAKWGKEPALLNQRVCKITVKNNLLDEKYLFHFLPKQLKLIEDVTPFVTVKHLSVKKINEIKIPLPPLVEQQRIAALLDTADRILKQRESAIAKLDQLKQSVFVELFSNDTKYECEEITLGDCLRFINGRAYSQNELLDAGTPVIRIQNLNGGDRWYYSNLNLPENKYCDYGDLLFAWSASFGPYIWNGKKSIYHYHIWKIETTKKIDKTFAFYLLQSITQKIRNASHGASMLHMTKSGIEAWKIKLPSLAYQMKFVDFINQLQPIETAYKKSLQLMTDNTKSIQHQSFAVN